MVKGVCVCEGWREREREREKRIDVQAIKSTQQRIGIRSMMIEVSLYQIFHELKFMPLYRLDDIFFVV